MTREEVSQIIEKSKGNLILELGTGFGKTKLAIDKLKRAKPKKILILVPKLVLIDNWKMELIKWKAKRFIDKITFSTYISIDKVVGNYDMCILDEAHRLTESNKESLLKIGSPLFVFLSATLSSQQRDFFKETYQAEHVEATLQDAMEVGALPTPDIQLRILRISDVEGKFPYTKKNKNPKIRKKIKCSYYDRFKYLGKGYSSVEIECTARQHLEMLDNEVEYFKSTYMRTNTDGAKNHWLKAAGDRLKFLASIKNPYVKRALERIKNERALVFCSTIKEAKALGVPTINSKDRRATKTLEEFNKGEFNHLAACNMLNEGVSLVDCPNIIFQVINASEVMQIQKQGRGLRHSKPVFHFFYFEKTREEEIVKNILKNYGINSR